MKIAYCVPCGKKLVACGELPVTVLYMGSPIKVRPVTCKCGQPLKIADVQATPRLKGESTKTYWARVRSQFSAVMV